MKIRCEELDPVTPAVGLVLVPVLGVEHDPAWGDVSAAIRHMADRITADTPLAPLSQPYTLYHPWGQEPGPPLPVDTLAVYVGPLAGGRSDAYGEAAPLGWSVSGAALPRSPGGFIALDLGLIALHGVDVGTVATHEGGHALGLPHSPDPSALMAPTLSPGQVKDLNHSDAGLLAAAGWSLTHADADLPAAAGSSVATPAPDPHTLAGYVRHPVPGGWVMLTPSTAAAWASWR